jgi:hypothetical protein
MPAATRKTGASSRHAARKKATKSQTGSQAESRTKQKSPVKRFRVTLDKHERHEAYGLRIPFDVQKAFGTRARVAVKGTINGFPFRSSIFPMGGDGTHFMAVNRETREGAGIRGPETVSVVMERDDEPRTVEPPADFLRALRADRAAREAWEGLSYTHRKEHVRAVEEAKRPETRARRIERSISMLAAGKREFR